MAKKRRRSGAISKQHKTPALPKAAEIVGFTEADEAFFRAGEAVAEAPLPHDEGEREDERPSFWRRLFSSAA